MKAIFLFAQVLLMYGIDQRILAQQHAVLMPAQSSVSIRGTSSLHDWEEIVGKFDVKLDLHYTEKTIAGINKVYFSCQSASIVSENSIMTNKTHNALQVEKYPSIIFRLVSVDQLNTQNGTFSGTLAGDIELAGVTRRITLTFTGTHTGNKISIKGSKELNMTDFKIKPPTAMMGTLKTGEQVTVDFALSFQVT